MTVCIADANIVGFPTPRRFVSGMSLVLGHPFYVTPTVAEECVNTVRRAEERHWINELTAADADDRVGGERFLTPSGWLPRIGPQTCFSPIITGYARSAGILTVDCRPPFFHSRFQTNYFPARVRWTSPRIRPLCVKVSLAVRKCCSQAMSTLLIMYS